jgi:enoyl-CoA hydratase/carnithine racemase
MSSAAVHLSIEGSVATVVFDRPEMRNALSFSMYDQLSGICAAIADMPELRVVVFRGAGGAFVAGTDIGEFASFADGVDGVRYEARIEQGLAEVEALPVPTLAVVDGSAMGGGLMIATACDLRIASSRALFGAPIAQTVGNCLSRANTRRLERAFGLGLTRRMLLLAERIDAAAALAAGYLVAAVPVEELESATGETISKLLGNAPLSIAAARRFLMSFGGDDDTTIAQVYGSADFREGVAAFLGKRRPIWTGT